MGPKLRGVQPRKEQLSVRGNVRWRDNVQLVLIQQTSMHVSGTNPTFLERILIECRQSKTKVITTFDLCTCSIGEKGRESDWRFVSGGAEHRERFGSTRPKLLFSFHPAVTLNLYALFYLHNARDGLSHQPIRRKEKISVNSKWLKRGKTRVAKLWLVLL